MSHYNLIYQTNPEAISEENHKRIAKHRMLLNNKVIYLSYTFCLTLIKRKSEFDSADSAMETHQAQLEQESRNLEERLMNPPLIKKKAPLIRTSSSVNSYLRILFTYSPY